MRVVRAKLQQNFDASKFGEIKTVTSKKGLVSRELVDYPTSARVFNIVGDREKEFCNLKHYSQKEYDNCIYTAKENEAYKKALYSKKGCRLLNKLKNASLITDKQLTSFLEAAKVNPKFITKCKAVLYPVEMTKEIDFEKEIGIFNKMSFKDLGITKDQIFALFLKRGLLNYGK